MLTELRNPRIRREQFPPVYAVRAERIISAATELKVPPGESRPADLPAGCLHRLSQYPIINLVSRLERRRSAMRRAAPTQIPTSGGDPPNSVALNDSSGEEKTDGKAEGFARCALWLGTQFALAVLGLRSS